MSESATAAEYITSVEMAALLRISREHVTALARRHDIGFNLGGSAGYRFTELDIAALREALRPAPVTAKRRRRGRR